MSPTFYRLGATCLLYALASLCLPVCQIAAQDVTDPFEVSVEADNNDISAPDHRGNDAFLKRYGNRDDDLLSYGFESRIRRRLNLGVDFSANVGGGENAPFWFTSNRQGLSPLNSTGVLLDFYMEGGMRLPSRFYFNYGAEVGVAANYQSEFILQQMYVECGYNWFDLSIGSRERWGELKNRSLSSGSLSWSGNSRPVPQIRLEVPQFQRLGILGGWFSLKGHIAYGWYQDSDWRAERAELYSKPPQYTDNILYHSKALFLRVGDAGRFPLEFTWGLEMYSQFGGTCHNMRVKPGEPVCESYDFPKDINAYLSILLPFNSPGKQGVDNGNTLGSWHLAFDLTMPDWKYRLYYEHFFEDHSSMLGIEYKSDAEGNKEFVSYGFRRNWLDGLYGIEINAPAGMPFDNIVFEILNTKGQCGPVYRYPNPVIEQQVDGCDEFYNQEFYKSYSNFGYANGTPITLSPIYNKDGDLSFKSNRVVMVHFGIDGQVTPKLDYRVLATHTTHWGTYNHPLVKREEITSVMLECFYRFDGRNGWRLGLSAAADFDSGNLLGNNGGVMLTLSKKWNML